MTECPQCGTMNEDDVKNCSGCRVNMYWAFQHYDELAAIRKANSLMPRPETSYFLVETSKRIDAGPPPPVGYAIPSRSPALKEQVKRFLPWQSKQSGRCVENIGCDLALS